MTAGPTKNTKLFEFTVFALALRAMCFCSAFDFESNAGVHQRRNYVMSCFLIRKFILM